MPRREEARLEVEILRSDLGHDPTLLILPNEVGRGFYGALLPALVAAFPSLGEPIRHIAYRHMLTYGAGVGSPDLLVLARGSAGLELKSKTGRERDEQRAWHAAAERKGIACGFVKSVAQARAVIEEARRR